MRLTLIVINICLWGGQAYGQEEAIPKTQIMDPFADADAEALPNLACSCKKEDPRTPRTKVEFGLISFIGRNNVAPDITLRRNEPYVKIEPRLLKFLYGVVILKTELTNFTLVDHFVIGSDLNLDMHANLKSRWNLVSGFGFRAILWKNERFMLHLGSVFEHMSDAEAEIDDVYLITDALAVRATDVLDGDVKIKYGWKRLDSEIKLDFSWGRFTPYFKAGFLAAKINVDIEYGEDFLSRLNQAALQIANTALISSVLPDHLSSSLYAPTIGLGSEVKLFGPLSLHVSGSAVPWIGSSSLWLGQIGLVVHGE